MVVVLGLIFSLFLSLSAYIPSSTSDFSGTPPSPTGDTFIDDVSRWENETVILNGNLTINSTGELTLYNVTLIMNSTYDGEFGIYVKEGGRFLVYSSNITAYDTTTPIMMQRPGRGWISLGLKYKFAVYGNLSIQDSDIGYLWGVADLPSPPSQRGGIRIYSNDAIIRNSFIHNGAVHGIYADGVSNLTVFNTTLSGHNVSGIAILGSEISVEGCTITRNDEFGIRAFHGGGTASDISVVRVKSSIVNRNGFTGIECDWCGLELDNSEISYNGEPGGGGFGISLTSPVDSRTENNTVAYNNNGGIEVFGCTGLLMANNIIQGHKGRGIYLLSCPAVLVSNRILDNKGGTESKGIHINFHPTTPRAIIKDTILERNDIGIYSDENGNAWIVNSTISSNYFDIRLGYVSGDDPCEVVTLNTTFDKSKVKYVSRGSNLTIEWFMHVKVVDLQGTPVPNALVEIEDINGIPIESGQTDNRGLFKWNVAKEYFQEDLNWDGDGVDPGERTYYTPHNVTASKDGVTGYAIPEPFMSTSKTVVVVLNMTLPTFPDLTLSESDISFVPPAPIVNGTTISIDATIHNGGTENATNVIVRFYDGLPSPASQIDGDRSIPF
ncbi:MAG: right-handed parallel beta-helix repeat-containing protein, partial [Thermoplasmata archaeon]|nr:right-handed parallel beta-helix repeat-containing protein [Thermoplasmata archaeon]